MKDVERYCNKVQKQTKKILNKLFGAGNIADFIKQRQLTRLQIENTTGCGVSRISENDLRKYGLGYNYAKYRTLDNIIEMYLKSVELNNFIIKELEQYTNCFYNNL